MPARYSTPVPMLYEDPTMRYHEYMQLDNGHGGMDAVHISTLERAFDDAYELGWFDRNENIYHMRALHHFHVTGTIDYDFLFRLPTQLTMPYWNEIARNGYGVCFHILAEAIWQEWEAEPFQLHGENILDPETMHQDLLETLQEWIEATVDETQNAPAA